jgi:pimeloyl-ACP methyl ester carboxylesterase
LWQLGACPTGQPALTRRAVHFYCSSCAWGIPRLPCEFDRKSLSLKRFGRFGKINRMRRSALTLGRRRQGRARPVWMLLFVALATAGSGCAQGDWVRMRQVPANPLAGPLKLLSPLGPQPTARTMLLVRRYNLETDLKHNLPELLVKLHEVNARDPSADKLYSLAELAYLAGKRAEPMSRRRAIEFHGLAVVHAYHYLFDERFGRFRNPYDPEFRGSCDLYNGALESTLRIFKKQGELVPGTTHTIRTADQTVDATIVLKGPGWRAEDFEGFRFVSDYEIRGLQNQYHNYGLGVPLIAIRKHHANPSSEEKFYPPGVSFPVTAFMRVLPLQHRDSAHHTVHIELHDPLNTSDVSVGGRTVPLESDLTTPLAYALNQKQLRNLDSSTAGLLDPAQTEKLQGLYMLEPYQPGKIPVLMIHGLWSSPITWMEMFNDLRGSPEIRSRYQFWFYLYPSGEPFWYSAATLRKDLAQARAIIDPQHRQMALDQMVLVGHSMGGLVAELQTIDSGDRFWRIISAQPFETLKTSQATRQELAETFFFRPNESIRRVITLGTPFRGSPASNSTTRWLSNKLIKLPQILLDDRQRLRKDNPDALLKPNLIDVTTSIDSLAPDSPILPVMLEAPRPAWVKYHNIVGRVPEKGLIGRVVGESDGVVSFASGHLDGIASEIVVESDHLELTRHPLSSLEVRRILLEHLGEMDGQRRGPLERPPMTAGVPPTRPTVPAAYPFTSTEVPTVGSPAIGSWPVAQGPAAQGPFAQSPGVQSNGAPQQPGGSVTSPQGGVLR